MEVHELWLAIGQNGGQDLEISEVLPLLSELDIRGISLITRLSNHSEHSQIQPLFDKIYFYLKNNPTISSQEKYNLVYWSILCRQSLGEVLGHCWDQPDFINYKGGAQPAPLELAILGGNEQLASHLIKAGAFVRSLGKRSLMSAAQMGWATVLLAAAKEQIVTPKQETALHLATIYGHIGIVASLCQAYPSMINKKNSNNETALLLAIKRGYLALVIKLREFGALVDRENDLTGLIRAAGRYETKITIALLDSGISANEAGSIDGRTALHQACHGNKLDTIKVLIERGANVNAKTKEEITPLHVAASIGHIRIIQKLLGHGALPSAKTVEGNTSLHLAANVDVTRRLVEQDNTLLNEKNNSCETALHIAVVKNHLDKANVLLKLGIEADIQDARGNTALHLAVKNNNEDMILLLLKNRPNIFIKNNRGLTADRMAVTQALRDLFQDEIARWQQIAQQLELKDWTKRDTLAACRGSFTSAQISIILHKDYVANRGQLLYFLLSNEMKLALSLSSLAKKKDFKEAVRTYIDDLLTMEERETSIKQSVDKKTKLNQFFGVNRGLLPFLFQPKKTNHIRSLENLDAQQRGRPIKSVTANKSSTEFEEVELDEFSSSEEQPVAAPSGY